MTRPFEVIRETSTSLVPRPPEPILLEAATRTRRGPDVPYVISRELATAINVAITLDQPLLVTGEPGCGKTTLAWAIAAQLDAEVLEFHTKSSSVARDVLYTFDTLRRFHDASAGLAEARDPAAYVAYEALGRAILSERTKVVLIDEIDKAPRDFPNDLLNEIDQKEFQVAELSPPVRHRQKVQHVILITSNSERRLPAPFLRRCVYSHVEFPDAAKLQQIIALHTAGLGAPESLVRLAVERFQELRSLTDLVKPPATGELLGWVRVLARLGVEEARLRGPLGELPALEAMVKTLDDQKLVKNGRP